MFPQSCSFWGALSGFRFLWAVPPSPLTFFAGDPGTLDTLFAVRFFNPLSCLCAQFGVGIWRAGTLPVSG